LSLLVAGCGGTQPLDWQANAAQSLQSFQRHYFAGDTATAEAEFKAARNELARTGRPDLVARAELVRCAARTASLEFDDCPGFEALRYGARSEELAYADYLAGRGRHGAGDDPLSRQHRSRRHRRGGRRCIGAGLAAAIARVARRAGEARRRRRRQRNSGAHPAAHRSHLRLESPARGG
jgi:outer membrane murein-binding lipoprotein Lpp